MMHLDIKDMQLFVNVVDAGSITHGARRSNLSLPAASGRIRQLEASTGTNLFTREHHGVRLTEAGRSLYAHALVILNAFGELSDDLAGYARGVTAYVRLLANTHALSEFVPHDVGEFLINHPHVNVSIEEKSSPEIVDAVSDGIADIGIVAGDFETSSLITHPYRTDCLTVAVPIDSTLTHNGVNFVDLLDHHSFIGLNSSFAIPRFLDRHAKRVGKSLRQRMQVASFDAICRMVEKGIGIGIVPEATARRLQANTRFRVIPLTDTWARRELRICIRAHVDRPKCVSELVTWLAQSSTAT